MLLLLLLLMLLLLLTLLRYPGATNVPVSAVGPLSKREVRAAQLLAKLYVSKRRWVWGMERRK